VRVVHVYPFAPRGRHGGTLRLRAALAGSARVGEPELLRFDRERGVWSGPLAVEPEAWSNGPAGAAADSEHAAPAGGSLKRRLFPSTLWESGARPRRALRGQPAGLGLGAEGVVVLHTTYLAGLARSLRLDPGRTIVDVYDLVWLAHRNDAAVAPAPLRALRRGYAAAVRVRELRALARAGTLLVAGYSDRDALVAEGPGATWVPTPTPVEPVPPAVAADGELRVGVLGNFAHVSTRRTAELLLASPLAADPSVTIVLAGLGSAGAVAPRAGIEVLGAIARAEDFYRQVDCVVAPVALGSGIKCKLGESLLAGRPVVTTPLGASGYPPGLRDLFAVCDPRGVDAAAVRDAIAGFDPPAARAQAERELGWEAVVGRYAEAIAAVAS
jgi:hypothetical protein